MRASPCLALTLIFLWPIGDPWTPAPSVRTALSAAEAGSAPAAAEAADIVLSWSGGRIVVSPEVATVSRGAQVRWTSTDPAAVWVVAFPGSTPFANGRRAFNGGGNPSDAGGPIPPGAGAQEHKYWVFYPDPSGAYRVLDPKLVVVD